MLLKLSHMSNPKQLKIMQCPKKTQNTKSQGLLRLCLAPPSQESLRIGFLVFWDSTSFWMISVPKFGTAPPECRVFKRSGTVAKFRQYNKISIQYNTIQYSTVQCNTIQCNTIQYNTIQYNTANQPSRCSTDNPIQYNTIQICSVQYQDSTVQYSTIQDQKVQYNTQQYNTIHYSTIQ